MANQKKVFKTHQDILKASNQKPPTIKKHDVNVAKLIATRARDVFKKDIILKDVQVILKDIRVFKSVKQMDEAIKHYLKRQSETSKKNPATANEATANEATANEATANEATANEATANEATANDDNLLDDELYTHAKLMKMNLLELKSIANLQEINLPANATKKVITDLIMSSQDSAKH